MVTFEGQRLEGGMREAFGGAGHGLWYRGQYMHMSTLRKFFERYTYDCVLFNDQIYNFKSNQ